MEVFWHTLLANSLQLQEITSVGESLAYTWFGRPNWAYSESAQKYWIGSTKLTANGTTQHITEFDLINNAYNSYQVGSVYKKDDHNQTQILIRDDGHLVCFFTEHNGAALRIKISINPYDASSWGNEIDFNPFESYTYPSPYKDSSGSIFLFFRVLKVINGITNAFWYYAKSTDGGNTFGTPVNFYNNGATQNYLITAQHGDQVHFVATNGHPQTNSNININIYHFYIDLITENGYKSDGTLLSKPFTSSDITIVKKTTNNDTSWNLDISFKNGLPRILYVFYPDGRINDTLNKHLYFIEWNGIDWVNDTYIAETLSGYMEDDAIIHEKAYSPASRFDTSNTDIIWMPKKVNGILEIHKVDISSIPIYIEQLTFNSDVDNWRPISVPCEKNNLLWIKKYSYNMYDDWTMGLMAKTETL